jgi:hypothetical protein
MNPFVALLLPRRTSQQTVAYSWPRQTPVDIGESYLTREGLLKLTNSLPLRHFACPARRLARQCCPFLPTPPSPRNPGTGLHGAGLRPHVSGGIRRHPFLQPLLGWVKGASENTLFFYRANTDQEERRSHSAQEMFPGADTFPRDSPGVTPARARDTGRRLPTPGETSTSCCGRHPAIHAQPPHSVDRQTDRH